MMDTNSNGGPVQQEDVKLDWPYNFQDETHSSSHTVAASVRKLKTRVLLASFGVFAMLFILIPVIVIFTLPKAKSDDKVSTVDVEVTVQNMKFSPALENKDSPEYRNFTNTFCSEVDKVFHNSDMEDIYDGCIVTQIRNGSITVNFLVIFVSKVSPIDSDVKSVLITTAVEKEAGIPITVLGIFVVEATTVFIGEVRIIATEDNPTPRKEFGSRCKVSQSCKTFQAECLDNKCACVVSRHYHRQTDACLLSTTLPEPASSSTRAAQSTITSATETKASIPFSKTSTASTLTNTQFVSTSASKKNTSSSSTQMITSEASTVSSSISASVTDNLTTEAQLSLSTSPVISTSALARTSTTDRRIPYSSLTDVKSSTSTDSIISNRATAVSETKTTLSSSAVDESSTSKTSRKTSTTDTATLTTETKSSTASYTTKTFPTSTTLVISSTRSVASSTIESKPSVPSFLVSSPTSASITRTSRSSLTTSPTMLILPSLTATAETESSSSSPTRITSPSSTTATRVGTTSIDTLTTEANPYASSSTKLTSPVSVSSAGSTKTLDRTTARIKSTSTTILTTTPIEFVPVLQLLVPSAHKLEIGNDDRIICEISNVTDWFAIVLSKTSEGGNKHLIGNVTKSDDTWTANYGNGIGSHQYMFLQGFDIQYSANLTLVFNTVQCDDAAKYHCSAVPPGGSVAMGEISVTLDVFKKPSLQLNIPNDLREGMVNLSISCSASFGFPRGNSTLMQRLAGETAFTPISQPGQNEVEVRRNEIVDSDYACLKTVQYEFYTGLEGWNMTQIRCAINDGTGNETISDVGVIFIVPKTVCSDRENQNVTHPFNCQLYVSCTTDAVDWGSIHSSNCAGKECWLADGQCGTTTTAAVTTTPTRTTLLPGTPNMICDPKLQSAKSGDSVVYRCSLMYVDKVTQIAIPQLDFNEVNDSGISGEFVVSPGVKLQVHLESEDAIVLSFEKVDCALEGGITIGINDDVSKTVELRLIADATTPNLITPTSIHRNQEAAFLCSANLGRLDDGSDATYLEFQIKLKGNNVPITVNRGIEVLSISSSDCQNKVTMQFKLFATDLLNDGEIGCISTDIATKTQHLSAFSGPITILEPNVFFGAFNYDGVIGETISVSCAFQGIPDVQNITITRAERRDNVLTAYRDGSSRQSMLHFNITEAEWGKDSGSFTISFTPECGDGDMYYCAVAGFVTACIIDTKKRPEKPVLTLSVEMVEGQESSADGRSECRGEVGSPAGDLVIQILRNMTFSEYEVVFVDGYPMDIESDCGTVRTFQFYFEDLSDLNNTQTRCAVKNSEAVLGEALPVSETHIIQVVPGSYCDKINSSFHVHPYNCHYFVDCNIFGPGNLDFTKCIDPNSCPSELTGCHPEACEVLCAKDTTMTSAQTTTASTMTSATTSTTTSATTPQLYPYLKCNETVMADLGSALILDCELENIIAETIEVYHDGFMLFNESGFSGGLTSADGFITLTYSNLHIQLSVSELQCDHDGVYAVIVNEVVQANLTIVIQRSPDKPLIAASRFVLNQEFTISCQGSLGKPKGSRDMQIEAKLPGEPDFQPVPMGLSDDIKFDILECDFVKTMEFSFTVVVFLNSTEVRCKTISEKGNFSSSSVFFNIEEQEVEIIPRRPEVELGQSLAVQCLVTNVLGLTSIKFYHKNTSRPICDVVGNVITTAVDGVTCSGETTVTSGQLQVEFSSLRCDDEGNYICECNTEASTPVLMPLTVTTQPTIPVFTSLPLTLVENTDMLETETLTCEAALGHPNHGSLVIQTNKGGDFKTFSNFEIDKTRNEEDCNVIETLDVNSFAFDISWNNSQLRCVIENDNGTVTDYISEEFTVTLLPAIASRRTSATASATTSATTPQLYPYLKCNETAMADLGSALIFNCELENIIAETIEVYHDGFMLFNESGFSGGLTSADGFITLTYSNLHIQLSVSELQCDHDGVYAVIVNEVVQANLTIVIQRSPNKPLITASRFVLNQEATITCQGSLGKPKGSRDMQIEARFPGASDFQPAPIGLSDEIKFDILQCAFVKTVEFSLTVITFFNSTEVRCKTISEKGNFSSSSVFFNIEKQEVEIIPQRPEVELGQALAVQCLVTNVLGLTSIKFYHKNTSRPICDVVGNVITSAVDGVTCSGETTVTSGQLQVEFASLRCDDEGNYICECNTEASTPVLMPLTVTTQPTIPVFTSLPLTLVENTDMLETETFTCEAALGDPNHGSLVIQTNKGGDFKTFSNFEIDKTRNEEDCNVIETLDVNSFAFDISWNNSQLRCVIENDNGTVTDYISEEFTVTLLPATASRRTSATASATTSATTQLYPYLKCNETAMADLGSALIFNCELENIIAETIEVYHDGFMLFNESGFSGGLTSADGFITLTYSNLHIQLSVSELQCDHDGVYAVIVNEVVQANLTIVIQRSPNKPLITASRFVLNQEATITCQGSLGKPKGSRDMQIEARFPGASDFQPAPIGLSDEIKFDILQCAFVKTVEFSLTVVTFFNSTEVRCKTISEKGNFSSSSVFFNIEKQEVEIIPQRPEVELGQALAVQCLVTNVLGLTSIKFYHKNTSRPICDVVGNVITSAVDGVTCSGETTVTSGQLQVEFASLRCDDEGNYICECNTEASTPVLMPLTVTTQPTIPVFTSIPLTLVENTNMLETEALTCEADLGYPNPRSLVIQTNKEGDFKIYNFFEIDKTTNEEDCNVMERIDVNPFAFDISWNNSQLRCVIEDDNGNVTDYISEAFSVTLLPEFYCEGQDRITPHPFDTHDYINCTDKTVHVQSCYEKCPVISDGTVSCDTC